MTDTTSQPGPLGFAKMAGSSIAGRTAAAWVTDFLNAAYYRRPAEDRDVDDLRLAFCILTTYWYRKKPESRLNLGDLSAFHRAFGKERFGASGLLDREALLRGAVGAARRLVPGGLRRRRPPRLGHRVPQHDRARAVQPLLPDEAGARG